MVASLRWLAVVSCLHILVGCGGSNRSGSRGLGAGDASTNSPFDTLNAGQLDRVDLLFVIDNSSSMADKQQILAEAVPHLVQRLVSPNCVDEVGAPGTTPADPSADCPPPFSREFKPLTNIHVAIVTSSLGGHGASGPNGTQHFCDSTEGRNDHAELLGSRPRGLGTGYPGASDPFLNWNPNQGAGDQAQLASQFQAMVRSAGQAGCPQSAPLESMYRFLVDPLPPLSIVAAGNPPRATAQGIDQNILAQRQAFLRSDSLVAIVMVSDQNDCSIRDSDQFYYAAAFDAFLPAAASICGTNPNDPCCYSCGLPVPAGCTADPYCGSGVTPPSLTTDQDPPSLRCYDQKRRFGIDFLYPIKRYVNALTSPSLCTTRADLTPDSSCPQRPDHSAGVVPNPLFQDLSNAGGQPRDPSLVYLAAITGVPWQMISDPAASPSLRFYSADELLAMNLWSPILGDPHPPNGGPPMLASDPHMQESIDPRPGLPGPNASPQSDPIHGHEWSIANRDDLQYACIFDRPSPCTDSTCDCFARSPGENNPLCADAAGNYEAVQHKAKAYPGLRELELVHDFGKNGIIASICPKQLRAPDAQDYGYRPAVDAIVDRLYGSLVTRCLPRKLDVAPDGTVPCTVIEATTDAPCDPARNRSPMDPRLVASARAHLADTGACDENSGSALPDCGQFTFCEIKPADQSCLMQTPSPNAIGWCYVDPDAALGDPGLVVQCPANERRKIRFVGDNTPVRGSIVLMECHERKASAPPGGGF